MTQNIDPGIAKNETCQTLESGFETCPLYAQIAYKGTVPYRNHTVKDLILNRERQCAHSWVATFGHSSLKIIPLDYSGSQFDLYNKISRDFDHSFFFESLSGPEELSETSLIGFDPAIIIKGYSDKVVLHYKSGDSMTIQTKDPLSEIKKLVYTIPDQKYRYVGGAVGVINYDAIRLWEDIPDSHKGSDEPLMEFGIYTDGILYDNKEKKSFYFYYDKNRIDEISFSNIECGKFSASEISENLDQNKFVEMITKAKKYIHDGDIFQVVLSRKFNFDADGDNLKVYKILRRINPSPYLYHMKLGSRTIIGSSPEMLLRITGSQVETFPIAGTRPITNDAKRNEELKRRIAT